MDRCNKNVILGAGIAGISAAYHLREKYPQTETIVFEKNSDWGGLCGGFYIPSSYGDFWFDHAVHLSFAQDPYVQNHFHASSSPIRHSPDPVNYYQKTWIKHPAQNNLFPLPLREKIALIADMLQEQKKAKKIQNFEQWLKAQYGNLFSEKFPMQYTRKYWTVEAKDLSTTWVGSRFYTPNLEEILEGAMTSDTPNTYYAQEMRYPHEGQYRSFFKKLTKKTTIAYNKEVMAIDPKQKKVIFMDQTSTHYSNLISTIPLPEITKLIINTPRTVLEASKQLRATSVALVSLGFNKPDIAKNLWFYVYDQQIPFARVYSPSLKSLNNAPKNCSSLQAEIYFSSFKTLETIMGGGDIIENTIQNLIKMKVCKKEDIICKDLRILPYGNVIFTHRMEQYRQKVLDFLGSQNIFSCGRFGKWDYLWSDQSFLSGREIVDLI